MFNYHVNLFFFKQKTAYEIVDCDWISDVCSSDLYDIESGRLQNSKVTEVVKILHDNIVTYTIDKDRKSVV